jgi:hypothetical protein
VLRCSVGGCHDEGESVTVVESDQFWLDSLLAFECIVNDYICVLTEYQGEL